MAMPTQSRTSDARVAVLVDCENVPPEILEQSLRYAAQFGRVVIRRGYGNQSSLAHRWQEALVQFAFTPFLQFQVVTGKNTTDIALALDALEILFDGRADTFCLVTSDSDFAYLCRKLRERGSSVCVVGEGKTPDALRNASDQFFEWQRQEPAATAAGGAVPAKAKVKAKSDAKNATTPAAAKQEPNKAEPPKPDPPKPAVAPKRQPRFVVDAVSLMAAGSAEGWVGLSNLGEYLRRTNPGFAPNVYGHSSLLQMLKTYGKSVVLTEQNGVWQVRLADAPSQAG